MGLCLEPRQFVTGLARVPNGSGGLEPSVRFAQYERHTAWDLRSIRRGERPLDEVLDTIADAEDRLIRLAGNPAIADQPDRRWVDDWLHRSYLSFWARSQ
ncbi:MAG TPA: hypothetical protein VII59_10250 [Streptosporangiaceae bacterium]